MKRRLPTAAACALTAAGCVVDAPARDDDPTDAGQQTDARGTSPAVDQGPGGTDPDPPPPDPPPPDPPPPDPPPPDPPPDPPGECEVEPFQSDVGACLFSGDPEWDFELDVDVAIEVTQVAWSLVPGGCGMEFDRTMSVGVEATVISGIDDDRNQWDLALRANDWPLPIEAGDRVRLIATPNVAFETRLARVAVLRDRELVALFAGGGFTEEGFEPWPGWRVEPGPVRCATDPEEAGDFCESRMRNAIITVDGERAELQLNRTTETTDFRIAGGLMEIIDHGACNVFPQRPVRLAAVRK